jgi:peptidoglycan/LPS O-acetylase OafA/YrhL
MRAIAAITVVIFHINTKTERYADYSLGWSLFGGIGVDIFFIISGYIMMHISSIKETNIKSFLKARVIRVMPIYWLLTLLSLFVYLYNPNLVNSSHPETAIWSSFILLPGNGTFLVLVGWTLTYEFLFYIIFSTSLLIKSEYKYYVPILLISILTLYGFLSDCHSFVCNERLLEFVFGIILYKTRDKYNFNKLFLLLIFLLSIFLFINFDTNIIIDNGIPSLLFFFVMINMESVFQKYKKSYVSILMNKLGESSYSLYLTHIFTMGISIILLNKMNDEFVLFYPNTFALILLVFSTIVGYIFHILIEKNIAKVLKNLK